METGAPKPIDITNDRVELIGAPGFDTPTFASAVARAQEKGDQHFAAHLRVAGTTEGTSSDVCYVVTRQSYTCTIGMKPGLLSHRVTAIGVSNFYDFDRIHIPGVDSEGQSGTIYHRAREGA